MLQQMPHSTHMQQQIDDVCERQSVGVDYCQSTTEELASLLLQLQQLLWVLAVLLD